jgi:hypothetical protein
VDFDVVLIPDQYFIIPSTFSVRLYNRVEIPLLVELSLVDRSQITGKIFFRAHPISRMGAIAPRLSAPAISGALNP